MSTHRVSAPISGVVRNVRVRPGDAVKRGDVLCVQSMAKTEASVTAPTDGTVKSWSVYEGQSVPQGVLLVEISN